MNQNSLSPHRSLARGSTCWVLGVVAAAAVGCSDDTGSNYPTPTPTSTTTSTASGTTTALTSSTSPLTTGPSVAPTTTGPGATTSSPATSTVNTTVDTSDTGGTTVPDMSTAVTTGGESSGSMETDTVDVPTLDMDDAGADAATEEVTSDGVDTSDEVVTEVDASVSEETTLGETTDEVTSEVPEETSSTIDVASSSAADTTSEDGYGPNLVTNSGFEAGNVTGWTAFGPGEISAVDTYARAGTYSALATGRTSGDWNGIGLSLIPLVTQGTTYQVTGSVRVSTASDTVKFTVLSNCGTATYDGIATGSAINTGWLDLSGTYTVPVCANWTQLQFYVEGPPAGVDIFVDEIVIREVL